MTAGLGLVTSWTATVSGFLADLAAATSHGLGLDTSVRGVYRGVRVVAFVLTDRTERFDVIVCRRSLKGTDGWIAKDDVSKGPRDNYSGNNGQGPEVACCKSRREFLAAPSNSLADQIWAAQGRCTFAQNVYGDG